MTNPKTKAMLLLEELQPTQREAFAPLFLDTERFYATCYLIANNEHVYSQDKPEGWEEKIKAVHAYQERIEQFLSSIGLDGKELMAEITSDYLEDYVNYRTPQLNLDGATFMQIIKNIQSFRV